MITANIIQRVFRVKHANKTGSGYTIEKGDRQYLVSASHIFTGSSEISTVSIFHENRWKDVSVEVVFNSPNPADTIVFALPFDLSPRHPLLYGTGNIIFGTWGYFLGFPYMVETSAMQINRKFPLPLIKAGLISGMCTEREGIAITYLDGHANRGFSGGPAVWINPAKPQEPPQIIGTISGFVTEYPVNPDTKTDVRDLGTNAGIIEAVWIQDFFDRV